MGGSEGLAGDSEELAGGLRRCVAYKPQTARVEAAPNCGGPPRKELSDNIALFTVPALGHQERAGALQAVGHTPFCIIDRRGMRRGEKYGLAER